MDYHQEHLDDLIDSGHIEPLTDKQVLTMIWTKPRKVFQFIHATYYEKYYRIILILLGISWAFQQASSNGFGDNRDIWFVVGIVVLFGGLFGWIVYYLVSALIYAVGKMFRGKSDISSILKTFAYANIPAAVASLVLIPEILVFGVEMFETDFNFASGGAGGTIVFAIASVVQIVLGIWSFVLFVVGLSVTQNFSIGKAVLNALLPFILLGFIIAMIIFSAMP